MQARGGGARHFVECGIGDVGGAGQFGGTELGGLGLHACDELVRGTAQYGVRAFWHGVDNDEVAETLEEVFDEAAGVVAGLDDLVHGLENSGRIVGGQRFDDVVEQ